MSNEPTLVTGPDDPLAFDGIPIKPRPPNFDRICPTCKGHGRWNIELHHHQRSKQATCGHCYGYGWLEIDGPTPVLDIIRGPSGAPLWITRAGPSENVQPAPAANV